MKALLVALGLLALGGSASAQVDVIAERRAAFKRMGEHMQAMKVIADSRGDPASAVARVDDMLAWFQVLHDRFPTGSGTGDTKALPAIWSDNAGFRQAQANSVTQLQALRASAAGSDPAAFAATYQQTGAVCGACHRPFRAR
jgi:cytochrome c556